MGKEKGGLTDGENLPLKHVKKNLDGIVYDDGKISGYLVKYGEVTPNGDVFMPGCFDSGIKTITSLSIDEVSLLPDGTHGIGASNVKYK